MRDLDKLIAEKVMGETVVSTTWGRGKYEVLSLGDPIWYDDDGSMVISNPVPSYSENIADAWLVIEKLPFTVEITTNNPYGPTTPETEWMVTFSAEFEAHGPTAPHAICLAALKALGVEL